MVFPAYDFHSVVYIARDRVVTRVSAHILGPFFSLDLMWHTRWIFHLSSCDIAKPETLESGKNTFVTLCNENNDVVLYYGVKPTDSIAEISKVDHEKNFESNEIDWMYGVNKIKSKSSLVQCVKWGFSWKLNKVWWTIKYINLELKSNSILFQFLLFLICEINRQDETSENNVIIWRWMNRNLRPNGVKSSLLCPNIILHTQQNSTTNDDLLSISYWHCKFIWIHF